MDMSATVRKAVTDAEKQKHREQGCCYKCSKQGHIARNCPDQGPRVKATTSEPKVQGNKEESPPSYDKLDNGNTLADYAMKLTEGERDIFLKRVLSKDPNEDFADA